MPNDERIIKARELDALLTESVLLTERAKGSFRYHVARMTTLEELDMFHSILSEQKQYIIGYLKDSLSANSLNGNVSVLTQDMQRTYRIKLRQDEELRRKSELHAFLEDFDKMDF